MSSGKQDTGNPILDSLVNIIQAAPDAAQVDNMEGIHAKLLELAAKEPGGLIRRGKDGILVSTEARPVEPI